METVWTILAIAGVMGLFAFFWYAVKRRVMTRARREVGLPEEGAEAARAGRKTRLPPASLVLLSRQARALSREVVGAAVRKAWGVEELSDEETAESHWVFGQTEQLCTMSVRGTVYTVVSLPEPYKQDRDWYVEDGTAAETLSAWQQHRAWVSVDMVVPGTMVDLAQVMDEIGKLVAELADEDTLAVVRPATRHAVVFDREVQQLLRRRPVREVVKGPPTAIVILQGERRGLDAAGTRGLAALVKAAWGAEVGTVPAAGADFCALSSENGGMGFVQWQGMRVGVRTPEGAYGEGGEWSAESVRDPTVRAAMQGHAAWTMVEMLGAPVGTSRRRVYELLGKMAAALADERALLVYAPAFGRALPASPETVERLRGEDALEVLSEGVRVHEEGREA